MPEAWEFDISFDEKTGHVTRVVAGDNSKFAAYIEAQNRATDTSRKAVEKLIPLAQELKVIIALENVWNNLWVKPALFRHFVGSFNDPWVKAYFDIGNHVKYSPPQEWVKALGPLVAKLAMTLSAHAWNLRLAMAKQRPTPTSPARRLSARLVRSM